MPVLTPDSGSGAASGGTFNADILPSTTGLRLGNRDQAWDATFSSQEATSISSVSSPLAQSGFVRMASADQIVWRKEDDSDDIALSKDTSNILNWPGFIKASGLISSAANPASTGAIRLADGDAIYIRDTTGTQDIPIAIRDSSNRLVIGDGSHGIRCSEITSFSGVPSLTGMIRLGATEKINWRNIGDTSDSGINLNISDQFEVDTPNGILASGNSPNITLGQNTSSFPMLKRNGAGVDVRLADDSNFANLRAANISADSITTNNSGSIDLTASGAASSAVDLTSGAGMYLINYYVSIVTAAATSSSITVTFSWPKAETSGNASSSSTALTSNTVGDFKSGTIVARVASGGIGYSTAYAANASNSMTYHLTVKIMRLG